ncbi:TetR/AcrR family transcriptional regulator [Paracoccus aminophilus]|uniref:Transcriptional regulator, TetR family n=1 Tax=Paracoccus aminophilus JCM 7686 TaxID=1367847 RepID=S5Z052_PARAH|nr:TetR/AcrR family transcriptional regulator [Paracoccus aminophilus]AGT10851.1 transcriptional regulator, TetR family [Paracoccus aminophilus JCM 7686]
MRVSKAKAEESRQSVVDAASHLIRARGLDGVAVSELMQAAGLTHGGFYKKFGSRDDLVQQATAQALARGRQRYTNLVATTKDDPLAAVVHNYLTPEHRDKTGEGCTLAALAPEVSRSDDNALHEIFSEELTAFLDLLEGVLSPQPDEAARDRAASTLSTLVGALILSRLSEDPALSERFLRASADAILSPPAA